MSTQEQHVGTVTIIWPHATGRPVASWGIRIHDADSGRDLGRITTAMTISIDPSALVTADLTMLVDADGAPLGDTMRAVLDEDGENLRTGTFRYVVAEMRIADQAAAVGPSS